MMARYGLKILILILKEKEEIHFLYYANHQ
jgi:two-component system, OmpR family, response regulator ChvI